jgi:transketolase
MASIANGLALHGGILPYVGTFLVFADYMRPAIRLAVLMQTKVIFIFTHDSIGVGEDGPTHQPIEHVSALRTIPGLTVLRPADANETAEAWKIAVQHDGPVVLILTRQKLPVLATTDNTDGGVALGAYLLSGDEDEEIQVVLIATGSEVHLAVEAQQELAQVGVKASVVSMPSWELFESQPEEYREAVLPMGLPKLAVEAGTPHGWHKYVGEDGEVMGIERFGASAPGSVVFEKLGITVEQVVSRAMKLVKRQEV